MNVKCPNPACGMELVCDDQLAGKPIECSGCKQVFVAPVQSGAPEEIRAPAAAPVASGEAAPAAAEAESDFEVPRKSINQVIQGGIVALALTLLQYLLGYLPGMDVTVGRGTLQLWVATGLAVAILVILLRLLGPLRRVAGYYIGLTFRVTGKTDNPQLQNQLSTAGFYLVLIFYVGFIYYAVLPPVLGSLQMLLSLSPDLVKLIRLAFAIGGILLAIKLVLCLKPLVAQFSRKLSDQAVAMTEKADSKPCPACGARMSRTARFCPACGKASG